MRRDLTERKIEGLVRDSVKVSEAEAREVFLRVRRQVTVEVVQLPAGDEGKKARRDDHAGHGEGQDAGGGGA